MSDVARLNELAKIYPLFDNYILERKKEMDEQMNKLVQMRDIYNVVRDIVADSDLNESAKIVTFEQSVHLTITLGRDHSVRALEQKIVAPIGLAVKEKGWHETGEPSKNDPLKYGGTCWTFSFVWFQGPRHEYANRRTIHINLNIGLREGCQEYAVTSKTVTREVSETEYSLIPRPPAIPVMTQEELNRFTFAQRYGANKPFKQEDWT